MEVIYNGEKIEIDTELEPGFKEFDYVGVIDDYNFDDTLELDIKDKKDNKDNKDIKGQTGDNNG